MKEEKDIQREIEQKFKAVLERSEANPELRREVFQTISQIEAAAELIDLFTMKMVLTEGAMFGSFDSIDDQTLEPDSEGMLDSSS